MNAWVKKKPLSQNTLGATPYSIHEPKNSNRRRRSVTHDPRGIKLGYAAAAQRSGTCCQGGERNEISLRAAHNIERDLNRCNIASQCHRPTSNAACKSAIEMNACVKKKPPSQNTVGGTRYSIHEPKNSKRRRNLPPTIPESSSLGTLLKLKEVEPAAGVAHVVRDLCVAANDLERDLKS